MPTWQMRFSIENYKRIRLGAKNIYRRYSLGGAHLGESGKKDLGVLVDHTRRFQRRATLLVRGVEENL